MVWLARFNFNGNQNMNLSASSQRHRLTGIVLLLPFIAWSLTGIFFLLRPGYEQAYERVPIHQYALEESVEFETNPGWQEVRLLRSILGDHLLILSNNMWQHLELQSLEEWPLPTDSELALLLEDAFQFNPDRYGNISSITGNKALTDTGIELAIDWQTLNITQYGNDRKWIDRIYSIHYLQWTGIAWLDTVFGVFGLILLLYMSFSGWRMAFGKSRHIVSGHHSSPNNQK